MNIRIQRASVLAFVGLASASVPALGQMYTDTFELGVNMGRWTLGCKGEHVEYWSGYNGAYLRGTSSGVPEIRTRGDSVFTGDWTVRNATIFCFAMGVYERTGPSRPLTLLLRTDNGTPTDPEDDWGACVTPESQKPPEPGEPWVYISYLVPNLDQPAPPPQWQQVTFGQSPPAVLDWRVLMRHVSEVQVLFVKPGAAAAEGHWVIGVDDIRVEPVATEAPCPANCDGSTMPPILNANDFQCFLHVYAAGCNPPPSACYANCDLSTNPPILNANDFQCFLNAFAVGCT